MGVGTRDSPRARNCLHGALALGALAWLSTPGTFVDTLYLRLPPLRPRLWYPCLPWHPKGLSLAYGPPGAFHLPMSPFPTPWPTTSLLPGALVNGALVRARASSSACHGTCARCGTHTCVCTPYGASWCHLT
ncbi:unnamed protein product [Ilex paraguariensis]|uniref:Uncharacterized protein n=1 Tax=Ilex paraguariensis TaxID=185542 RepID=A0ABC8TGG0_9AQUA